VPYGEFGSFSPDGSKIAYLPQTQAFRTWKRYRGGWSPDIWVFDLTTLAAANVTKNVAVDEFPDVARRHGLLPVGSGRGLKQNIWALTQRTGALRQITDFRDYDVTTPSLGPGDIVFGAGGRLYLLDLATDKVSEVRVQVVDGSLDAQGAQREGRRRDRVSQRVSLWQARGLRGARRDLQCACGKRPRDEPVAKLGRGRAVPTLVARRQDAGVLERIGPANTS
jgi:tricorn protease